MLLLWYSMINILDYNLCCFSMIMNWRDSNLWGVFFFWDCVNPPLDPKSSVSQMGGKSSIFHPPRLGSLQTLREGPPAHWVPNRLSDCWCPWQDIRSLTHTNTHAQKIRSCGYWLERDWTPGTGLYWSVDLGLVSTATLLCFKVFCNEGIVWLYIIILTIIIVVVVHDYYLSSLSA